MSPEALGAEEAGNMSGWHPYWHGTKPVSIGEIAAAEGTLEELKKRYLREHGWSLTSDGDPGNQWMWTKECCGERLTGGTDQAMRMEREITAQELRRDA